MTGFLPAIRPLHELPAPFQALDAVVRVLPTLLQDDSGHALADKVAALPDFTPHIPASATADNAALCTALMRDLSILASAYVHEGRAESGKPRTSLPPNIAKPLDAIATTLGEPPIMAYSSYCLSNVKPVDEPASAGGTVAAEPAHGWTWEKLRLIRAFDGGPEEATFILVHAEIEALGRLLVQAGKQLTSAVAGDEPSYSGIQSGLQLLHQTLRQILVSQLAMFNASDPANYEKYVRPWIFGFWPPELPDGVVFEGTANPGPRLLRGETGAQSTLIPTCDALLGVRHTADKLREMLEQLEEYRPAQHREWLCSLRAAFLGADAPKTLDTETQRRHKLRAVIAKAAAAAAVGSPVSGEVDGLQLARLFNDCVLTVGLFRYTHVVYSDAYTSMWSPNPLATGGTPYRAYLRRHRFETMESQIGADEVAAAAPAGATVALDDGDLVRTFTSGRKDRAGNPLQLPDLDEYGKQLRALPTAENGIPSMLLDLMAGEIAEFGAGRVDLQRKCFPNAATISSWHVDHAHSSEAPKYQLWEERGGNADGSMPAGAMEAE